MKLTANGERIEKTRPAFGEVISKSTIMIFWLTEA